ncbi:MAG: hypothetical protein ACFNP9_07210, partial [Porphyromonas endodontalis]
MPLSGQGISAESNSRSNSPQNYYRSRQKHFYHVFLNAFQPGSEMDARLQTILDPDRRMVNKKEVDGKTINE